MFMDVTTSRSSVEKLRAECRHLEEEIETLKAEARALNGRTKINFPRLVHNLELRKEWVAGHLRGLDAPRDEAA